MVRQPVVLGRLAVAAVCVWYVVSCGGRSSEIAGPPKAGSVGVGGGGGGGQGGRAPNGGTGGSNRGGSSTSGGRGGTAGAQGGASARGGTAPGGEAGEGGAGQGGVGVAAGGQSGSGTGGRPSIGVCDSPYAWSENLESCNGDFVHRPTALACTPPPRDEAAGGFGGSGGEANECDGADDCYVNDQCSTDDDCGPNAYCLHEVYDDDIERIYYHFCYTPCGTDADCADDELCACDYRVKNATRTRVQLGMCVPADCRTDADCDGESLCIDVFNPSSRWERGSRFEGFHCQSPADECYSTERCPIPVPDYDCCPVTSCNFEDDRYVCGWKDTCNLC